MRPTFKVIDIDECSTFELPEKVRGGIPTSHLACAPSSTTAILLDCMHVISNGEQYTIVDKKFPYKEKFYTSVLDTIDVDGVERRFITPNSFDLFVVEKFYDKMFRSIRLGNGMTYNCALHSLRGVMKHDIRDHNGEPCICAMAFATRALSFVYYYGFAMHPEYVYTSLSSSEPFVDPNLFGGENVFTSPSIRLISRRFEAEMDDNDEIKNFSLLNKMRYRKICRSFNRDKVNYEKKQKNIKDENIHKNKKNIKNIKNSGLFEAEMFPTWGKIAVPHKISEDQFSDIKDILNRFVSEVEKTNVKIEGLSREGVKQAGAAFGVGVTQGIGNKIGDGFSYLFEVIGKVLEDSTLSLILAAIVLHLVRKNLSNKTFYLTLMGICGSLAYVHRDFLLSAFQKAFKFSLERFNKQDFEPEMLDPSMISDSVVLFLACIYAPKLEEGKTANFLKYMGDVGRQVSGTENTVNLVVRIAQRIIDYASQMMGFESFSLVSTYVPKVDEWIADCRRVLSDIHKSRNCHTKEMYEELLKLEMRAYDIQSKYRADKTSFGIANMVRPILGEVSKVRIMFEQEGVGISKIKQAAAITVLSGGSQIGKSRELRPFTAALLAMVLEPEQLEHCKKDLDSHVYSYQPEVSYADGYCGQTVCFMDEFDLVHETLLQANNASTMLIRSGNVFPNMLNMAGLEQKGNVFFRSKIIICTTNVNTVMEGSKNAVRYPEAVANRVHFEVSVRVKREYADPATLSLHPRYWALDPSKLPEDGHFVPEIHDYVIMGRRLIPGTEGQREYYEKETIEYPELLRRMAAVYKKKQLEALQTPYDDMRAFEYGEKLRKESLIKKAFGAEMGDVDTDLDFFEFMNELSLCPLTIGNMIFAYDKYKNLKPEQGEVSKFLEEYSLNIKDEKKRENFVSIFRGSRSSDLELLYKENPEKVDLFVDIVENVEVYLIESDSFFKKALSRLDYFYGKMKKIAISFYDYVKEYIPSFEQVKQIFDGRGTSLLVFGFAVGCFLTDYFIGQPSTITDSLVGDESFSLVNSAPRQRVNNSFVAEYSDTCMIDVYDKIWNNSYYSMHYVDDGDSFGYGFFLKGGTFVFCSHYSNIFKARGYDKEDLILKNSRRTIIVPVKTFIDARVLGRDVSVCEVKNTILHPDITHLMCDPALFVKRKNGEALVVRKIGKTFVPAMVRFKVVSDMQYSDVSGKEYVQPQSLIYEATTAKGHCGLPVFINDPSTRAQKFVGFHVAGDGTSGMSNIFDFAKEFSAEASYIPVSMEVVGRVDRAPGTSGESMIRRSPLYEAWGPANKAPAALRTFVNKEGEKVSPMLRAIARYDKPILTYDQSLVDACVRASVFASSEFFKEKPRKISMEEAILGMPGVDYMEGLNRSTSPGYAWNMNPRPGFKGKERFLGNGVDIDLSGPDFPKLVEEIQEAHAKLQRGERPMFYFSDSLKDETLKKEKAYRGDTRLFCPSPIVYQILNRMYFADFHRRFMEVRIRGEHTVGINVYSSEWDMLARKHLTFGDGKIIAGDFKSFDASQSAQILKAIGEEIISTFEDRQYDSIRRLLWMNVYDSHHIFGKDIVRWKQSLPSGDPGTTNINCLFVGSMMRMCFVHVNGGNISSLRDFSKNVILSANGDDHLMSVSEHYLPKFNQNSITEAMSTFGMTYTSENKDDLNPPPSRKITEVEFLKRSFRYEPMYGRYAAPLRLETILEMPYWSKRKFYETIWKDNLENAVRELALHDPRVFAEWAPRMSEASYRITHYIPEIVDRKALLEEIAKKEIKYKAEIDDSIRPVRNALLRTGRDKEKILSQMIVLNTALRVKSVQCLPTKIGFSKGIYLGHTQCEEIDRVVNSLRIGPANNDNNLMKTELNQANDMAGSTQILNEAGVKTVTREQISDIPRGLLKATQVGYDQSSIYDFFKKPVRISTFEWNTQSAGAVLYNASLPQDVFSQAVYRDKLRGFYGFRGTMVLRVQVNGTKFQSGRLLLVFIPQGNVTNSYPGMRLRSLKAATQLPRVELDLGSETEIVMEVPYVSPTPYYNLATQEGPFGRAALLVYEPLATGTGSSVADVTMWVHFKDVEMVTPTFTAEMGERKPRKRITGKNPSEQELAEMTNGSISGGLSMMARAADSFAKVPLLTSLAGPASWALNCMAGVASAFGYSKPTSEEAVTKTTPTFSFNMQNHNGVDTFPNMGLDASNKMSIMPGFAGTDVDEMSLNHLVQIPAYVTKFNWATSDMADSVLLNVTPSPQMYRTSSIVNLWTAWDMTPLDYFSSLFYFWRGSFVITLKFVKTQYHSGRLLIAWTPSGDPNLDETSFVLREIVDLRETSEFRFVIPYVATSQYLPTTELGAEDLGGLGKLKIFVLNELVAPTSVSSSVGVIVEYSAGPDFELMCPRTFNRAPFIVSTWQAQMGDVVPASNESKRPDMNQGLVGIGSAMIEEQSLDPALYCVGEKCNSILQLLKRYSRLRTSELTSTKYSVDLRPFVLGACYSLDVVSLPTTLTGDYMTLFGYCFAYVRGSVRICCAPSMFYAGRKSSSPVVAYPATDTDVVKDYSDAHLLTGASVNFQPGFDSMPSGCAVPAYQRLHARLNRASTSSAPEPIDVYGTPMRCSFTTTVDANPAIARVYRAAGDDFTLGYFLGTPLVTSNLNPIL